MPILFVSGWGSGAGKSTVCQTILSVLLQEGVPAGDVAYIKPVTQCEAVTEVVEFCKLHGITSKGIGPVVFAAGVTNAVIGSEDFMGKRESMLKSAVGAVLDLAKDHKVVIVDGVGYPAVGTCCGVGNGDVASALKCPVILVAPPGLGDAIDTCEQMMAYFTFKGNTPRGIVFNKCRDTARHKASDVQPLVIKYFSSIHPSISILGFLPAIPTEAPREDLSSCVDKKALMALLM